MKRIAVICLAMVLLVSFGVVIGCDESNVEVTAGKYVNQEDASEYLEIKADGTFDHCEEAGIIYSGEWRVKGNEIIFSVEVGQGVLRGAGTVEGNKITDNDGAVWVLGD